MSSRRLCRPACELRAFDVAAVLLFAQFDPELSSRQFGVEVARLTNDERTVPLVVEKLINYLEMHGLYTEGIYRKSGSTNKIKELKQGLDTGDCCMSWRTLGLVFQSRNKKKLLLCIFCSSHFSKLSDHISTETRRLSCFWSISNVFAGS